MLDKNIENNRKDELEAVALYTNRVAKVVKGGKRMRFQALVVVGNRNGKVGLALSKGQDPKTAIEKATLKAKKNLKLVELNGTTIPFELTEKFKSARIFLKPARPGTGIISSSAIRPILELAGIKDIYTKIYGTKNKITNGYCVMKALSRFN